MRMGTATQDEQDNLLTLYNLAIYLAQPSSVNDAILSNIVSMTDADVGMGLLLTTRNLHRLINIETCGHFGPIYI